MPKPSRLSPPPSSLHRHSRRGCAAERPPRRSQPRKPSFSSGETDATMALAPLTLPAPAVPEIDQKPNHREYDGLARQVVLGPKPILQARIGQLVELSDNFVSFSSRGNIKSCCRSNPDVHGGCKGHPGTALVVRFDEPWQRQRISIQRYAVCSVDDALEAVISCLISAHSL